MFYCHLLESEHVPPWSYHLGPFLHLNCTNELDDITHTLICMEQVYGRTTGTQSWKRKMNWAVKMIYGVRKLLYQALSWQFQVVRCHPDWECRLAIGMNSEVSEEQCVQYVLDALDMRPITEEETMNTSRALWFELDGHHQSMLVYAYSTPLHWRFWLAVTDHLQQQFVVNAILLDHEN